MSAPNQKSLIGKLLNRALSIIFYLLYHQFAWSYDWVADVVSIGRWKTWIAVVIPRIEGSPVLEIGCGPGHLQLALESRTRYVAGLDESSQMLNLARRRLSSKNSELNLVRAEAQALPFRARSFQKIVATFPSDYIYQQATLKQIEHVLAPAGELVLLPAAWITGKSMLDRAASWLFSFTGQAPRIDEQLMDEKFQKPLNRLSQAGFQVNQEMVHLADSMVLLITAVKITPEI